MAPTVPIQRTTEYADKNIAVVDSRSHGNRCLLTVMLFIVVADLSNPYYIRFRRNSWATPKPRAFAAMMTMKTIDIAKIEPRGEVEGSAPTIILISRRRRWSRTWNLSCKHFASYRANWDA
jgi:hypothetical protein